MSVSRRNFLHAGVGAAAGAAVVRRFSTTGTAERPDVQDDITLVRGGTSSYAIVVLPDAPPAAAHGAGELQSHLRAMSGATLPIVSSADATAGRLPAGVTQGHLIVLGGPRAAGAQEALGEDAFRLRTNGARVEINGGGTRGTLYGCYALLEDVLGVRWFTVERSVIPTRPTVTIPPLNRHEAPAYEYRFPYWREAMDANWAVRNRCNGLGDGCRVVGPACPEGAVARLDPSVGGSVRYGRGFFVHTFPRLVPQKSYPALWEGGALCLTNPATVDAAVATLRPMLAAQPDAQLWSVSQPDTADGFCTCARCRAVAEDEGAQSGPLIHFVNAVAERLGPEFPNVLFDTLAYHWSEAPPKRVRPRDNVRVRFAPIGACVAHALGTCDQNRDAYEHLVGWSNLTKRLYVWNYVTNFHHCLLPLPDITSLCADVATYHRYGAIGLFSQGYFAQGGGGSFGELKAYLVAKLMWNPSRDPHALVAEYLRGVYGAGAPYVQQWLDAIEAETRPGNGHGERHAWVFDPVTTPYISAALAARGAALLDAAERAAVDDDAAADQVRKARLSVTYLQMQQSPPRSVDRVRYTAALLANAARYHIEHPTN